jgi:cell division protein FtsZ
MSEETIDNKLEFDLPMNKSSVIKVIGVGGGGSNAVNHMKRLGIKDVNYIICNTDAQALDHSEVSNKVQLGASLTEGMGAGANPETGRDAALESLSEIESILETNTKMLFVTAGMGGGTGTGAAPIIAKLSQEMGLLTVGIVTMPFSFEGVARMKQAEEGLRELKKHVDSLIVIKNDKLREVYGNLGFKKGFQMADSVLATAVKAIAEVITSHYGVNIDLKDAKTVLANSGTAIMGSAVSGGDNRAKEAIINALDSPLLNDNQITGSKNVLLLIISGDDDHEITIDEIGVINEHVQAEAGGSANIILGIGQDEELKDNISVTIIATGFEAGNKIIDGTEREKGRTVISLDAEIHEPEIPEVEAKVIEKEPIKPDPMTTPIEKTTVVNKEPNQVDLFTAVAEAEARVSVPEETEEPKNETNLEEADTFTEDFEEDISSNEVVFELTQDIQEEEIVEEAKFETEPVTIPESKEEEILKEESEETTFTLEDEFEVGAVVGHSKSFAKPEAGSNEQEEEQSEEETTHFVLEDLGDLEQADNFTITSEVEISDTNVDDITSEIVEDEEEPTELDPMNFSIDEISRAQKGTLSLEDEVAEEKLEPVEEEEVIAEKKNELTSYTLDDIREVERMLGTSTPTALEAEKEEIVETEAKDEFLDFGVKKISQEEAENKEEVNPVENKIDIAKSKIVRERTKMFSNYQHKFPNTSYSDSKEPAYKRLGLEIQNNGISDEENISRTSVNGDGSDLNINSSNSFLHDNVD